MSKEETQTQQDEYIFDYRLGYVRAGCQLEGFDVLGEDDAPSTVVTLGGYTTAQMAQNGQSWAHALYAKLGSGVKVLNGCTDGYTAAQTLTMLIRDGILFAPKRVICLTGFYDVAYKLGFVENKEDIELLKLHPFATPMQVAMLRDITSRFGLGNGDVFYGVINNKPAWQLWLGHMREMKCICDEFEIEFSAFLQPCVFSGKYMRNDAENLQLCEKYSLTSAELEVFYAAFQHEYAQMQNGAKELEYVKDLSRVFDGYENVYVDECHVKDECMNVLVEGML